MTKSGRIKAERARAERKWRLRHLIYAIVIITVICGGGWGYVIYRTNQEGKAPTEAAEKFLSALQTNSPADAYLQLCAATKKQYTESSFADYVKAQPQITAHKAVSVDLSTVNGQRSAVVTENITTGSGSATSRSIVLTSEGGDWLVCGQPY